MSNPQGKVLDFKKQQPKQTPDEYLQQQKAIKLSQMNFPDENLHPDFLPLVRKALIWNSISRMRCHQATWRNLIKHERPFLMGEIILAIECLFIATPVEMGQTLDQNLEMLEGCVDVMRSKINEIEVGVIDNLKREIEAKMKASAGVPIGKEIFAQA